MKTLMAALIAGLFGLTSVYAVASPVTGKVSLSQSDEKKGDEEKKQDYKSEQKATADGDEREQSSDEKKSD